MSNREIGDQLSARFDRSLERTKPGAARAVYVSAQHYIDRLNSVFGIGAWGWEASWTLYGDVVVVEGHLSALDQRYHGVDGHTLLRMRDGSGEAPDALANAIKGAESGALVRAARLLGVGLYLWEDGGRGLLESEIEPPPEPASSETRKLITTQLRSLGWTKGDWRRSGWPAIAELTAEKAGKIRVELDRIARAKTIRGRAAAVASRLGWQPNQLTAAIGIDIVTANDEAVIAAESAIEELEKSDARRD